MLKCNVCYESVLYQEILHNIHLLSLIVLRTTIKIFTEHCIYHIAEIYDIVVLPLQDKEKLRNIFARIKAFVPDRVRFKWFQCDLHEKYIKSYCLDKIIFLIANKCFKDIKSCLKENAHQRKLELNGRTFATFNSFCSFKLLLPIYPVVVSFGHPCGFLWIFMTLVLQFLLTGVNDNCQNSNG